MDFFPGHTPPPPLHPSLPTFCSSTSRYSRPPHDTLHPAGSAPVYTTPVQYHPISYSATHATTVILSWKDRFLCISMLFAASSASTHPAPADIKPSFVFLPPSSLSLSLARSLSTLLFSRSSRSNDADVDRTIVLYVHYVLIPRGPGYIISMLYFHPLSRCNQIFFSWRKDKLPNLPDLDSRPRISRTNPWDSLAVKQNIVD